MAEYFETMRQFLETQERVMAAYMGGDPPASTAPAAARAPRRRCRCRATPIRWRPLPVIACRSRRVAAVAAATPRSQRSRATAADARPRRAERRP
jgi:hypothetical protein